MKKDYYEILNVPKTATQDQIKAAYRKLAIKYHPDRNPSKSEEEKKQLSAKFQEVNTAYHVLSDAEKRKKYDLYGDTEGFDHSNININDIFKEVFKGGFEDVGGSGFGGFSGFSGFGNGFSGFGNGGFGNGFSGFGNGGFGNGFSTKPPRSHQSSNTGAIVKKIKPTEHKLPCSIDDFYCGAKKKLKITRNTRQGQIEEIIVVPVLPGYKKSTKLTFENKGDEISANVYNDVVVVLDEKVEEVKRDGNDICYEARIGMREYFLNKRVTLNVVGNRTFSFFAGEVGPGDYYVFKGCGMPNRKGGPNGDLKVRLVVKKDEHLYRSLQDVVSTFK